MIRALVGIALTICMLACSASCGVISPSRDYEYEIINNSVTITRYTSAESGRIVIPSKIRGKSVTSIGEWAFNSTNLTSIVIPNSVTSISDKAFYCCYTLSSITIPNSVISIGDEAFADCRALSSVYLPYSVISIGTTAFSDCSNLTSITVDPSNNHFMAENGILFSKDGKELVCYPAGKPNTSYSIPSSVTSIGVRAFIGSKNLTSVIIPNSVTSIGDSAFVGCLNLTSVAIPNSVTKIGNEAFSVCMNLTSVAIPYSVNSIGDEAFAHCYALTSITVDAANNYYEMVDGELRAKDGTAIWRPSS